jgi:hypothetical protein
MPTLAEIREARIQFWLGVAIVSVTAIMQGVVLFHNAGFTMHSFGTVILTVYLTAASCYILLPWVEPYLADHHTAATRLVLLAFCVWIGLEELLQQAQASTFQAPEGVMLIANLASSTPSGARAVAAGIITTAVVVVIEVLWHLHGNGATLVTKNWRHVKTHGLAAKKSGQRRKP